MSLKKFRIKNFKPFKDGNEIDFSNINLIFGPNSAGKSSFIDSLLLLSQTSDSNSNYNLRTYGDDPIGLNRKGKFKKFPSFKNLSHKMNDKDITYELKFELNNERHNRHHSRRYRNERSVDEITSKDNAFRDAGVEFEFSSKKKLWEKDPERKISDPYDSILKRLSILIDQPLKIFNVPGLEDKIRLTFYPEKSNKNYQNILNRYQKNFKIYPLQERNLDSFIKLYLLELENIIIDELFPLIEVESSILFDPKHLMEEKDFFNLNLIELRKDYKKDIEQTWAQSFGKKSKPNISLSLTRDGLFPSIVRDQLIFINMKSIYQNDEESPDIKFNTSRYGIGFERRYEPNRNYVTPQKSMFVNNIFKTLPGEEFFFKNHLETFSKIEKLRRYFFHTSLLYPIGYLMEKLQDSFIGSMNNIDYIGTHRSLLEYRTSQENNFRDLIRDGESAVEIIKENKEIKKATNNVLTQLGINYLVDVETYGFSAKDQTEKEHSLVFMPTKSKIRLSSDEIGEGVTQILPIIVKSLSMTINSRAIRGNLPFGILSVEEPELHTHPALQSKFADYLVSTCKIQLNAFDENDKKIGTRLVDSNFKWVIATHSEQIIRRILRRVKEGDISPNNVNIYYVEPDSSNESKLKKIGINEKGELLDQWPSGFFGESFDNEFGEIDDLPRLK